MSVILPGEHLKVTVLPRKGCWVSDGSERIRCTEDLRCLPFVDAKYDFILKENYIPYRKLSQASKICGVVITKEVCEYWNPILFEEEIVSLPIYTQMPDLTYNYCGKTFSGNAPTYATARLAKRTQEFIEKKIFEYEEDSLKKSCYDFAKDRLSDKSTKFCTSELLYDSTFDDIEMNGDHIKILRVPGEAKQVVIFNMKRIARINQCGKDILLNVPNNKIAGLIIGKNFKNIHLWEEALGVTKIRVYSL